MSGYLLVIFHSIFKLAISFSIFILLLDAVPLEHTTRTILCKANPCYLQPQSDICVAFIAHKRCITLDRARSLVSRALKLYDSEKTQPFALFERNAVVVACLASRGTLRPGPDDDCAACGAACLAESRPEVCELYCTKDEDRDQPKQHITSWKIVTAHYLSEYNSETKYETETNIHLHNETLIYFAILLFFLAIIAFLLAIITYFCKKRSKYLQINTKQSKGMCLFE